MRPGPKSLHIILVVQYPTKVELVITLNTTKAIGSKCRQCCSSVDEVIE